MVWTNGYTVFAGMTIPGSGRPFIFNRWLKCGGGWFGTLSETNLEPQRKPCNGPIRADG